MAKFALFILTLGIIVVAESRNLRYGRRRRANSESGETERREVCIEDLGCYPDPNPEEGWSWSSMMDALEDSIWRDSREDIETQFRFWTPGATAAKVITNYNFDTHINQGSGYDIQLKTKFIIHGYNGGDADWPLEMKDALMRKEPCNVFIVDWSNGDGVMYGTALANTWVVGAETGHFIHRLVNVTGLKPRKIHIIGHSLGAHTSGYAGKWVKSRLNRMVGRITGLDPAGPDFYDVDPDERLDMGDASFVDVIHTNWAEYTLSGFGLFKAIGHLDFYPNGGEDQPGCLTASEAELSIGAKILEYTNPTYNLIMLAAGTESKPIGDRVKDLACSHSRAYEYFIESISSEGCHFLAEQCTSWEDYTAGKCTDTLTVKMGYYANRQYIDQQTHKKFYLRTNSAPPFCIR